MFDKLTDISMAAIFIVSVLCLSIVIIARDDSVHISDEVYGPVRHLDLVADDSLVGGDMKNSQLGLLTDNGRYSPITDLDQSNFNASINSMLYDKDYVFLAGEFTSYGQSLVGYIAKMSKKGQLDREFLRNMGTGFDDKVDMIHLLSNGDLIAVGNFRTYNGTPAQGVAYLHSDGKLKKDFGPSQGLNGKVNSVSEGPNGDLVLAGSFTKWHSEKMMYMIEVRKSQYQ